MRFVFYFIFLCSPSVLFSQGEIHGYVHDKGGNPLAFATIIVESTNYGITTNKNGYYSLRLPRGDYAVTCRYIGFKTETRKVVIENDDVALDFVLSLQQLEMDEIIVTTNGEDPAYPIIRGAIKKRPFYNNQVNAFTVDAYVKGMIRLLDMPQFFKQRIRPQDMERMALDSNGQGIIYLAESFTKVSERKPDQSKVEVLSNRVSGQDGFGYDFPIFINFYDNVVDISYAMEKNRGFVSPIANNALFYYKYKLLGTFVDNGVKIYSIDVTPKRKYEPLFSGTINITDNDYRIFSTDLTLTKESQLQFFDTLIISQLHTHQQADIWRIKNQVIKFHSKQLGVAVEGDFVNVYSDYDLNPKFPKGYFDKTIISYDTSSNKKSAAYWDTLRPIPLEAEEERDYIRKDSIRQKVDSMQLNYRKSAERKNRPVRVRDILSGGVNRNIYGQKHIASVGIEGLVHGLRYNTVEGISLNPSAVFARTFPKQKKRIRLLADVRYGFHNQHLNPWGGLVINELNKKGERQRNYEIYLAGGKRISQFNKFSSIPGSFMALSTLFWGNNYEKLYENHFFKVGYKNAWNSTFGLTVESLFEKRIPVANTTDFTFFKSNRDRLTPNFPIPLSHTQFDPYRVVVFHAGIWYRPGQRFIQYPHEKVPIGTKAPTFYLNYYKGIPSLLNSAVNYDQLEVNIRHHLDLKLHGRLDYMLGIGSFINKKEIGAPDYKHFYANPLHVTTEYVSGFQQAGLYDLSTNAAFYTEFHVEHHSDGMLTNKIPLFRKLNWNLVEGVNYLYSAPGRNHLEVFAGLMNIFKVFRVDAVMMKQDGMKPVYTYRIGLEGLLGNGVRGMFFRKKAKIVNAW